MKINILKTVVVMRMTLAEYERLSEAVNVCKESIEDGSKKTWDSLLGFCDRFERTPRTIGRDVPADD